MALNETQIKALKDIELAGKAGLHHRDAEHPSSPHHKTCGLLLQEGLVDMGKYAGTYRINRAGIAKLAELRSS